MADPIQNLLGAYLDGELDERAQSEVMVHLETCQACQNELEELRRVSLLLRAAPRPSITPAQDFKAQLMLQLPRRAETTRSRSSGWLLPWLAPAVVLAGWLFIQVTLGLSTLVSWASQAGLVDGAAGWAAASPQQMTWFTAAQVLFGGMLGQDGQTVLQVFNAAGLFQSDLVVTLLWQVGLALLYWGALTLVWRIRIKPGWTTPPAG